MAMLTFETLEADFNDKKFEIFFNSVGTVVAKRNVMSTVLRSKSAIFGWV